MGTRARIALLIDTATTWGTGLIEGIADYAHESADWQILLAPRGKYDQMMLPDNWNGDGVIARITHERLAEQIIRLGVPAVDVSWYRFGADRIPRCTCDERAVAALAAKYFTDLGFRQFAYCGSSIRPNYVDHFGEAFVEQLRRKAYSCHTFYPRSDPVSVMPPVEELDRMIEWLRSLAKPVGLLAFDSLQARQVTEACALGGINVPHEVAVLGGEYDRLSCTISKPQLSSIDHAPHLVGHTAADLLARLIRGEAPPIEPVFIPVTRVIACQSTDTVAVADELLAAGVRFIKDHCHERIRVSHILAAVPISRRALEKGFRNSLGRSPAEEIRRVRVERAVQMLCDTSWAMPRIAKAAGFERPELLTRAFRRELRTTPSEFRKFHLRERKMLSAAKTQAEVGPRAAESEGAKRELRRG
jgi:LacI family transcriptional regulator, galactose operon repressor